VADVVVAAERYLNPLARGDVDVEVHALADVVEASVGAEVGRDPCSGIAALAKAVGERLDVRAQARARKPAAQPQAAHALPEVVEALLDVGDGNDLPVGRRVKADERLSVVDVITLPLVDDDIELHLGGERGLAHEDLSLPVVVALVLEELPNARLVLFDGA